MTRSIIKAFVTILVIIGLLLVGKWAAFGGEGDSVDSPYTEYLSGQLEGETTITIEAFEPSYYPAYYVMFSDTLNKEVGRLTFTDKVHFEGDADESAKEFIKHIGQYLDPYLDGRDRDIAALLEEILPYIEDGSDQWPTYGFSDGTCRPIPGPITIKEQELDRLKKETALHKKIEKIIESLKK
jgi:hypothetical protein